MTSCLDEFNSTTRLMAIKVIAKLLQVCGSAIEGMENQATVLLKLFHATGLFLYPLKTSEILWFSDVFRGYRKRPVAELAELN